MLKLVLDTNTLVSAFFWKGKEIVNYLYRKVEKLSEKMEKIKNKLIFGSLLISILVVSGCEETVKGTINKNNTNSRIKLSQSCTSNDECEWISTNCCPESSGAHWACISKVESVLNCSPDVICPTVESPKPIEICECVDNKCSFESSKPDDYTYTEGTSITEDEIDFCERNSDCIDVPYTSCSCSTKRVINKEYLDEYNNHPEWQEYYNEETCSMMGVCQSYENINYSIKCEENKCKLVIN